MRAGAVALLAGAALCACGGGRPADGLSRDQLQIVEAVASDDSGALCLRPVLRGRIGPIWAHIPPGGFRDLAQDSEWHRDIRLTRQRIGRVRVSDERDCFTMLVPRVDGDRALTALFLEAGFIEFGLRRENGRWLKVAEGGPTY